MYAALSRLVGAGLAVAIISSPAAGQVTESRGTVDPAWKTKISAWPEASRKAADMMSAKHGPPTEVTDSYLIWGKTGPWKRTIISKEETPHEFPGPHTDVMEQFIDYKVPIDAFSKLAEYDGSVIAERTKGELSARCDMEGANFLALNLADEIINRKISVDEARSKYTEQIMLMKQGKPAPYTEKLLFTPGMNTRDPDKPVRK